MKSIIGIHNSLIPPWREFVSDKVAKPKAKVKRVVGHSCCKLTATKAGRLARRYGLEIIKKKQSGIKKVTNETIQFLIQFDFDNKSTWEKINNEANVRLH